MKRDVGLLCICASANDGEGYARPGPKSRLTCRFRASNRESSGRSNAMNRPAQRRRSGERADFDIPERDRVLLVLKPEISFRKLRVVNIERGLAIQHDDEVIAVRRDLIPVPLIGLEGVLP